MFCEWRLGLLDSLVSIQWPSVEWDVAENSIDVFCCDIAVFIEVIPKFIVLNFSACDVKDLRTTYQLNDYLHFESELHLWTETTAEYSCHNLSELVFRDASVWPAIGYQSIESVTDDTRQLDVLNKGNFINWLSRSLVRDWSRPECQIIKDTTEVRFEFFLDELWVKIGIKVF